ncbi:MAG TPA: hypothetical protein DIU35_13525 [Candidatus Latescibacteria bacterium]|nr:hypothetical protein [Gemmatimonadota bacterium]MBB31479.1 hypothetical protein [Gemmatimonadota bacterium]HCR18493.1 hypothetical protein [Candidatus Latescibacterota bacterium]|tara:strand:+ start:2899 stop:3282 length:384 start_codon:yes stop_codon:yes gene_type:complete
MGQVFYQGGVFIWPLLLLAVVIVVLSGKRILELSRTTSLGEKRLDGGFNSILFWGCVSLVVGFLGHYLGVYGASGCIVKAESVSPSLMAAGYQVSLSTIIFGMLIFLFSAVIWYFLQWRYQKLAKSG